MLCKENAVLNRNSNFQKGFVIAPIIIWAVVGLFAVAAVNKTDLVQLNLSGEGGLLKIKNLTEKQEPSTKPASISESDLVSPVKEFYSDISSKKFDSAWSLLSKNFQDYSQGYDNFVRGYKTTLNTLIKDIQVQDLSDNKVYIRLESSDNINGNVQTKTFEGTWKLVHEDGQWKLDSPDIALKSVSPLPTPPPANTPTPQPSPSQSPTPSPTPILIQKPQMQTTQHSDSYCKNEAKLARMKFYEIGSKDIQNTYPELFYYEKAREKYPDRYGSDPNNSFGFEFWLQESQVQKYAYYAILNQEADKHYLQTYNKCLGN